MALEARDGARLWNRAVDGVQAAGDGFVIVTSGGNELLALHAADDTPAWQAQYQGGAVQLLGGLVYVDESPDPLIALDEYTGALVWTLPRWKQTAIAASASGAQIYVDCLEPRNPYVAGEGVLAFDTQQHHLLWKQQASDFHIAPVAVANPVFIAHGTELEAVRASDGKQVWRQQAEEPNAGPVAFAVTGDTLYVRVSLKYPHVLVFGCGTRCERSYSLSALRPTDGTAYWRHYEPSGTQWPLAA